MTRCAPFLLLSLLVLASATAAEDPAATKDAKAAAIRQRYDALQWKTGSVHIAGKADLALPAGYRYLESQDARWVETELWGNPPDEATLGLIALADRELFDDCWAILVSYEDEGHVDDSDAKGIDYADMLKNLQERSREANPNRIKHGYPSIEIKGWAETPHYDDKAKKLYWAKRLHFGSSMSDTLNYDVRILGRTGTLVYQAISSIEDLPAVAKGSQEVLAATSFTAGNRYEDFVSGDKAAEYGVAGLIAGGTIFAASKIGLWAIIGKFAFKLGWLLIFPAVWLWKFVRGNRDEVRR